MKLVSLAPVVVVERTRLFNVPFPVCRVFNPDPVFLPGFGSGFQITLDPDPFSVTGSTTITYYIKKQDFLPCPYMDAKKIF